MHWREPLPPPITFRERMWAMTIASFAGLCLVGFLALVLG